MALALTAGSCAASTTANGDLAQPSEKLQSGISIRAGEIATVAAGDLRLASDTATIVIDRIEIVGDAATSSVATIQEVLVYDPGSDALGAVRGRPHIPAERLRALPNLTVNGDSGELSILAVVRGVAPGVWHSDYAEVHYRVNGVERVERLRYSVGLCVDEDLDKQCTPGVPGWWGGDN